MDRRNGTIFAVMTFLLPVSPNKWWDIERREFGIGIRHVEM